MVDKIHYFLEHGFDVHTSVSVGGHISVSIFNSVQKMVADADYFDHKEHGALRLSISDNSGRKTLRLSDDNYPSNRTFDAIVDDILDMCIRKLPVTQDSAEALSDVEEFLNLFAPLEPLDDIEPLDI